MTDLPSKRKRKTLVKLEADEDSDNTSCDNDKDEDFMPPEKKPKTKSTSPKKPKEPKIKKEPKPKAVRRKAATTIKGTRKKPIKTKEAATVEHASQEGITGNQKPLSAEKIKTEEEIEQIIAEAKQNYQPWYDEEVVAETTQVNLEVAKNVMSLLDHDCTIPFIVRYRKQMTGGLQADKLREIQSSYEEVKQIHKKVENILKTIKHEKFDTSLAISFLSAKALDEVELLYTPFKPGGKRTLAERSKELGLEPISVQLLEAKISLDNANLSSFIKAQKGLQTIEEILSGIQHIIADKVSKDRRVLDFLREKIHHPHIRVLSSKSANAEKEDKQAFVLGKSTQNFKYENYYQLNTLTKHIAAHQVMALNRGEKQKVLKVKIELPHYVQKEIKDFIWHSFFEKKYLDPNTCNFMKKCFEDSYDRLVEPYLVRQIRSELSKKAEKESIDVFGANLLRLLLTPPVRGKVVLGIDPGFKNGCKVAVVSLKGEVLATDVIHPHNKGFHPVKMVDAEKILTMISTFNAEVIALGNGTACRETEVWLSNLIKSGYFHPHELKYCIVNEQGASIYSITKEAEAELPGMDPNLRSAASIARRLQDPLLEYVKIEPKHLGVGMYQHDVSEVQLKKTLDSIVEECVSFVGVDLNVCPEVLLRKISGLSSSRAKQIVEFRTKNSCFVNRQQLLEVKGLGKKSFEQCAGFVKIFPETCSLPSYETDTKSKNKKSLEPLDRTIIHPESYDIARKFLKEIKADPDEIGKQALVDKVKRYMTFKSTEDAANMFDVPVSVMQLIVDAFSQLQDYDIRKEFDQPLFRTAIQTFSDLKTGQELTGRVTNVTGFGAFVDAGVGTNGLIHVSKMKGRKLNLGDRVTVKVLEMNLQKKRLGLELVL